MFTEGFFTSQGDLLLKQIAAALQISKSDHEKINTHYEAVASWLCRPESPLMLVHPKIYAQGSLALGTINKPIGRQEFDLDAVLETEIDWRRITDPVAVLNLLEMALRQHSKYASMVERKNRCIRLNYAGQFHMDILPACLANLDIPGALKIPDREMRAWKDSHPRGFDAWFKAAAIKFNLKKLAERAEIIPLPNHESLDEKLPLQIAVQLIKRQRDIAFERNSDNAPVSIVLTTLAGQYYTGSTSVGVTIKIILESILRTLATDRRLEVYNPVNPAEKLSDRWDNDAKAYRAFTQWVTEFYDAWRNLSETRGIHNASKALERLFGEDVTLKVINDHAQHVESSRNSGSLRIHPVTAALTTIASPGTIAVKRNTFYGD